MTYEEYKGAGVFADLLIDITFKKAFNPDTQNKVCLINLLNAILDGEISAPIVDVQSRDKEYNEGSNENRTTIFDLHCVDSLDRKFIIEVQIASQQNIVNRAVYYASQTIIAQGERGKHYDYRLDPVITVVIMEFDFFKDDRYIRKAKLREKDGNDMSNVLNFAFVNLPCFNKTMEQLETKLDLALYALKNIKTMSKMPEIYANTPFAPLFFTAELANLSKEEQRMIDKAQQAKWDAYAIRKCAIDEGVQKGRAEGRAEGIAIGEEKGRKQGEHSKAYKVAKAMLADGMPVDVISKYSGLSAEEIKAL